jgi:hypothetical protein
VTRRGGRARTVASKREGAAVGPCPLLWHGGRRRGGVHYGRHHAERGVGGGGVRRSVLAVAAGRQRPKASGCGRCRPMRGAGGTTAQNRRVGSLTCGASATVPWFKPI